MKNTYKMTKTVLEKTDFDYEIIFLKDRNIKIGESLVLTK